MGTDKLKIFQYIVLGIFGAAAIGGTFCLATGCGGDDSQQQVEVRVPITIWGPPLPGGGAELVIRQLREGNSTFDTTTYEEKNPATMYLELLEALSVGKGPDIVIIEPSLLLSLRAKIYPMSYESFPLATFRQTYVEGAEVFALSDGIYAFPILVDPLVLYWNRDLFTNALVSQVPEDWVKFVEVVPKLSHIKDGGTLTQSSVAFGEFGNVLHAKEILSALFMQTGISMVYPAANSLGEGQAWTTDMVAGGRSGNTSDPVLALRFYTDFANPIKKVYSWNKSFDRSREAFAANKVAMYAGFASEADTLAAINPNLNFDIALWPQSTAEGRRKLTYGKFYALAVLKQSPNKSAALTVAQELAGAASVPLWEQVTNLSTTRRDMLSQVDPSDPYAAVIVRSALISQSWLEPDMFSVDEVFSRMVDSVNAGQVSPGTAVSEAGRDLQTLLDVYQ